MKTIFMGTPEVAVPVLSALIDAKHEVIGVYTRPDRPTGRKMLIKPSPVKEFSSKFGLQIFQPESLNDKVVIAQIKDLSPTIIVVAAYGLFLPSEILVIPPLGCLNIHPSILPKYRGPSPVQTTILKGEEITGVTIMQLDDGMDSGPVVTSMHTKILEDETSGDLTRRLFKIGAELLVGTLPDWEIGMIRTVPQNQSNATLTRRISRADGHIDWSKSAEFINRQIRAYHPWPGTSTSWNGKLLKIIETSFYTNSDPVSLPPGSVINLGKERVGITTGNGILELISVQLEGRSSTSVEDFVLGHPHFIGSQMVYK